MATVANLQNSAYWQKRFEQLEDAQNKVDAKTLKEAEEYYDQAIKQIELDIEKWYRRFAKNNNITMAEARQWLTGKDLKEFKWDVKDYIKAGKENAVNQQWMKELENASAKYHISKLESLKLKTQNSLEQLCAKYQGTMSAAMGDAYKSGYYHTAYELQKGFGVGWDISGLDQKQIEKIISKPWAVDGINFSSRIWNNKEKLIQTIHNELTQNVMIGGDVDKAIANIAKTMNTSKSNAARLVMTEGAYFHSVSQKDSYNATGVKKYQILATLDSRTSEICRTLDGEVYEVKDMEAGLTAPPFHVRCRSTTVPYFDDDFGVPGERAARDEETGKTYYIPDNIKYSEWEQTFVNGGDKSAFEAVAYEGVTHYAKTVVAQPPKPKKEYLTKKKLIANIANADVEIEELNNQLKTLSGTAAKDIEDKIATLNAQKLEWQAKLDEKLKVEQTKALKKQELDLQAQIDAFDKKTYSGIWKDDITTDDWGVKQHSIAAKKKYFEDKLSTEKDPDEIYKLLSKLDALEEFNEQGKALNDLKVELQKIKSSLTTLNSGIKIDDTYSQAHKDAAYWFKSNEKAKADNVLRPVSGNVWKNSTTAERNAAYQYTCGSGGFNRPLRGYDKSWSKFKGVGKVSLNNEGYEDAINKLTDMIERSTYDFDIWLQRGVETTEGAASFLNIPANILRNATQGDLEQLLLDKTITDEAFVSCGSVKGAGFRGYIFNIYAPKGTKMLYAEPFSAYGNGAMSSWDGILTQKSFGSEFETIIQRGTSFKITKVEKSNGNVYIDIEVVSQR